MCVRQNTEASSIDNTGQNMDKEYWNTQSIYTVEQFSTREKRHGRAENRTQDLLISSKQRYP